MRLFVQKVSWPVRGEWEGCETRAGQLGGLRPRRGKKCRRRPTLARAGPALPSAKRRLTSVFGMGTGIAASLWPPAKKVPVAWKLRASNSTAASAEGASASCDEVGK